MNLNDSVCIPFAIYLFFFCCCVLQYRPLLWRNTHPFVVVDRHEDITNPNDIETYGNECNRSVVFYGYVRGSNLKQTMKVHIIGLGDYTITEMNALNDPCPIPDAPTDESKTIRKVGKLLVFFCFFDCTLWLCFCHFVGFLISKIYLVHAH